MTRLFPEKAKPEAELARPLFLDIDALETPYLALANAAREILRMGDLVDALLRLVPVALFRSDKTAKEQATKLGRELDRLHEAVKAYLAKLDWADLTERDMTRLSDLVEFGVNLGHAGDILERDIIQAPTRRSDGEKFVLTTSFFSTRRTNVGSYFPSCSSLSSVTISEFRSFAALIVAAHQASLPLADISSMFALMAEKKASSVRFRPSKTIAAVRLVTRASPLNRTPLQTLAASMLDAKCSMSSFAAFS